MAAAGGGKIRSRRYHIASKPYAKSKQQQSGLISRVTDTVKSIVPSWLQKYFNSEDAPEEGESVQRTEENCQLPPPNGSEEGPLPLDGCDSPQPEPSTSNTEPSTSRASLNFQESLLARPPLSRSHLNFTPLDSFSPTFGSSLFMQPSTSSAPGPFSTGKEIKDNLSVHEDDNISTTSGFSSRASDKDVPTSKTASLPQLWSPETDRTNSGPQPSQSSLKKPAFNLSVFGTSSNSSLNSTVLISSQLGDSPFYPGKTIYGGAAGVRSSRTRPGTPYQAPVRRQIKAKPAGAQPCGVTSATARRILQSLERMSSPLADAKRIPAVASSNLSPGLDGVNVGVSHLQPKKKRMDLPPVQKLVVPVTTSLSGSRSVSFRPTLTPGGVSRTLERATRQTPTRQSPLLPEASTSQSQSTMGSIGPVYPLSSTPAASSHVGSGGGKMKRERTTPRPSSKRHDDDEVVEAPDLPPISLPINTNDLPIFSFSTAPVPPTSSASITSISNIAPVTPPKETFTNEDPPKASTPPCVPFTFSSPIVKATAASPSTFSPAAGFTFSAPVAMLSPSMSNGKLAVPIAVAVKPTDTKSTDDFEGPFKPAKTLKQGSVLDLLKAPGFASPVAEISPSLDAGHELKSTETTTSTTSTSFSSSTGFAGLFKGPTDKTCGLCSGSNTLSETKCVCSAASQPNSSSKSTDNTQSPVLCSGSDSSSTDTTTATTTGFGTLFPKPAGTWDCDTCLVINKPDVVKCVACETAKPGTGLKPALTLPSAFSAVKTVSAPVEPVSTGFVGFGDKFKKPEGAWECDTCMVQNKAEDTKCVACMSAKPGSSAEATLPASSAPLFGLGDKFKQPEGSWECDVCLVQNKATDVQCVACQSAKPGAKVEPKAFGSFGSTAAGTKDTTTFGSSTSNAGGFKFGTTDSTTGTGGLKFGGSLSESTSSSGGFKFGVPFGSSSSEVTSKDNSAPSGFKFGASSGGFKFGAASTDDKTSDQPAAGSVFNFGATGGTATGTGSSCTDMNSSKGGFTFGVSKPEEKTDITTVPSSSVNFTSPPSSQEKNDDEASSNDATSTNSTTTTTTTTKPGSVFDRLGKPNSTASAPQVSTTFGSSQASKEPAAPSFTFGKPDDKKEAAAAPSMQSTFRFCAARKDADSAPAATGGFTFSKPSVPAEQPPPAYTFKKPAEKSETSTAEASKTTFSFGQNAADSAAPKPAFSFMAGNPADSANSTSSTTASSSTLTPSLFGSATTTTTSSSSSSTTAAAAPALSAAPSTFMFGQPAAASNDAPPATAFVFGQTQDTQPPAPSAAPLNAAPAPAAAQPFIFGAPAAAAPPPPVAAPSFGFGAAAPSAASSAGPSVAPSPFVFNSAPSGGFGANQPPSFASSFGSPFTAAPSQPPGFGAKPNAAPVFGQQTNSTPVFGTPANSAQGGGFQFGGASGFGATNNASGVFTFGGGTAGSPAPPTNLSIAPQGGAPGGGFNFNQTPAFNIGPTKSFTASPAGQQTIAGRKIKTAVRRRK